MTPDSHDTARAIAEEFHEWALGGDTHPETAKSISVLAGRIATALAEARREVMLRTCPRCQGDTMKPVEWCCTECGPEP